MSIEKLENFEKETIILFNESREPAEVYTYNRKWITHIEKNLGIKPVDVNEYGGRTYKMAKSLLRLPRKPKILSDSTKQKLAENAKKNLHNGHQKH